MEIQDVSFGASQIHVAWKGADHSRPNTVLRRIPFCQGVDKSHIYPMRYKPLWREKGTLLSIIDILVNAPNVRDRVAIL